MRRAPRQETGGTNSKAILQLDPGGAMSDTPGQASPGPAAPGAVTRYRVNVVWEPRLDREIISEIRIDADCVYTETTAGQGSVKFAAGGQVVLEVPLANYRGRAAC